MAIECGLKEPVEGFEGLSYLESTGVDSSLDAALTLFAGGHSEDAFEEGQRRWLLAMCPGEKLFEVGIDFGGQAESFEVLAEAGEEVGVGAGSSGLGDGG